jgi:endonuclease G
LSQSLDQLEALDLDEFRVFQVPLNEIEQRAGFHFPQALWDAISSWRRRKWKPR